MIRWAYHAALVKQIAMGKGSKNKRPQASIAVIVSRYNASVTDRLRTGAVTALRKRGAKATVVAAPGSYELPALALAAAESPRFDGVVALGCLIRGQTRHDRYIAQAVAHGLMDVTMRTGKPCAFGVITAETPAQAKDRAGGSKGNKGQESADAVLDALEAIATLTRGGSSGAKRSAGGVRALPDKARADGRDRARGADEMEDDSF